MHDKRTNLSRDAPPLTRWLSFGISQTVFDVCMLVSNDVARDPRVRKSAQSLVEAGYSVGVVGISYQGNATAWVKQTEGFSVKLVTLPRSNKDRIKANITALAPGLYAQLRNVYRRGRRFSKNAPQAENDSIKNPKSEAPKDEKTTRIEVVQRAIRTRLNRQTALSRALAAPAIRTVPKIIHAHDLDTLEAGFWVARVTGATLIFDSHEIWWQQHAEDEALPEWKDYYQALEAKLLPQADHVITVCDSIADFFVEQHGVTKPTVVRNAIRIAEDSLGDHQALRESTAPLEVLFHGGFAYNRGLEELLEAAKHFQNAKLVLRGFGTMEQQLRDYVQKENLSNIVRFDDPVPMSEVVSSARRSDIGIIPYRPVCLNNRYSTPNKIFEFLAAGLAIVASDLPELARIIHDEAVGQVFAPGKSADIARVINDLAANPATVTAMRKRAFQAAQTRQNWAIEEIKLLALYASITRPTWTDRWHKIVGSDSI
jgi:glycogen(starch) synthase